ncbi:MAG: putative dinucleotide-binding enzyme [Candidatus Methanohalarchaeum thermophilum]|uniref:Dinucleotide-binding enzyme n=1 Tax=Methanohalarchaeum thermophilum TaxID=1903181 RepID=A0A1Q6DXB8_METT1|nr:MAG: putative dinucleotide-binding enzyme [Candidatus Methanohalarchaeum thermophilum]
MKIGFVGGTGYIGEGLSLRWAKKGHEIFIGSRNKEKAKRAFKKYNKKLGKGYKDKLNYGLNKDAILESELVVISLPAKVIKKALEDLKKHFRNEIVVSPVAPLYKSDNVFKCKNTCAALKIQDILPSSTKVVSAFHSVPASHLKDTEKNLNCDVVVCGDDENSKSTVKSLAEEIKGVRCLNGGPLSVSKLCESLTPLLINLSIRNELEDPSVKFIDFSD